MIIDSPIISGSIATSGSLNQVGNITVTGSLTVTGNIIGSFTGSATNAVSASFATSASTALTASFVRLAQSASFWSGSIQNAVSASYALTASFISGSGGGVGFPFSGSAVITGSLLITELSGSGVRYLTTNNNGLIVAQTASAAIKQTQAFTSSANQTSFTIADGYVTGLVDVFINGSKLAPGVEFTDTSGTVITLATGSSVGDLVEFVKYFPALGVTNNALRQLTTFTASAGQTVFSASYTPGLLDIFYNGSRLSNNEYTANNGTFFTLATASIANDILDVFVYSYQVGAFSGIGGAGVANQIAFYNTTSSITGSDVLTVSSNNVAINGTFSVLTGSVTELQVNATGVRLGNAITDTHTVTGSLNMSGSFSTVGTITAQTLVVQTITSSTVYSSGSNIFGNNIANTQVMTGSVTVTGSLAVVTNGTEFQVTSTGVRIGNVIGDIHPITGSVGISGSLTGVGATFSGAVTANNNLTAAGIIYGRTTNNFPTTGLGYYAITTNNFDAERGGITIQVSSATNTLTTALSMNYLGAATFSSTVQSRGFVAVGASGGYTTGDNTYINLGGAASTDSFGAINMPFGDRMRFNSYHGFEFKTSNTTASPITMVTIGINGTAIFNGGNVADVNNVAIRVPNNKFLSFYNAADTGWAFTMGANTDNSGGIGGNAGLIFQTGGSLATRMTITSGGVVNIGSTSGINLGERFNVIAYSLTQPTLSRFFVNVSGALSTSAARFDKFDNNSTTSQVFLDFTINNQQVANGSITANGASQVTFTSWSDRRLKENIIELPSQLSNIMALKPVEFDYKDGSGHQIGFIAQEVQEIYPDIVGENAEGYLTISGLGKMESRLIKALQEANAKITSLEEKLERNNII